MLESLRIALVHDEFIRRGGAEIVFEELLTMFPHADVFALYAGNMPRITLNNRTYRIHTSFLQRFPLWFRKHPGRLLPFLPHAAEQFDFSSHDLVISSSSGFSKSIITRSTIPHICYCHTPPRYLWEEGQHVRRARNILVRPLFHVLQHYLRMADFAASRRPDTYIANSQYTASRIRAYYRLRSTVIYPPVETSFFTPQAKNRKVKLSFLTVGRLSPSKYIDHAITVCEKLRIPLAIVGVGQDSRRLQRLAGSYTTFLGSVSRPQLRTLYRNATALIQPGREDFGMACVEALACGTPVIAFGEGGVGEIIDHWRHGILYKRHSPEHLAEAIREFLSKDPPFDAETLQRRAMTFSASRFRSELGAFIINTLQRRPNVP